MGEWGVPAAARLAWIHVPCSGHSARAGEHRRFTSPPPLTCYKQRSYLLAVQFAPAAFQLQPDPTYGYRSDLGGSVWIQSAARDFNPKQTKKGFYSSSFVLLRKYRIVQSIILMDTCLKERTSVKSTQPCRRVHDFVLS